MSKLHWIKSLLLSILSLYLYFLFQGPWLLYISLFFLPDLILILDLLNPKVATLTYPIFHNEMAPALLGGLGLLMHKYLLLHISLIWLSHINLEHLLRIVLKSSKSFNQSRFGQLFLKQKES